MIKDISGTFDFKDILEINKNLDEIKSLPSFNISGLVEEGKKLVVSDFDETAVNITFKWVEIGKQLGIFPVEITPEMVLNRKEYYITKLISDKHFNEKLKPHIKDPNIKTKDDLACVIYKQSNFYDDLLLTEFGNALKTLNDNKLIDLVFISHTMKENKESKENFIKKNFPGATYYLVDAKVKKSEVINDNNLNNYSTFADDSLNIIYDVILNTNSVGKEFIIPKFGYNDWLFSEGLSEDEIAEKTPTKVDLEMLDVIDSFGCKISYVKPL